MQHPADEKWQGGAKSSRVRLDRLWCSARVASHVLPAHLARPGRLEHHLVPMALVEVPRRRIVNEQCNGHPIGIGQGRDRMEQGAADPTSLCGRLDGDDIEVPTRLRDGYVEGLLRRFESGCERRASPI